jgi:polyhydroxybutyrate depolymerase
MTRPLRFAGVLAALALGLVGCSSGDSTTATTAAGTSTSTSTSSGAGATGGASQGGSSQGGGAQGGASHGGSGQGGASAGGASSGGAGQGGGAPAHACKETTFGGDRPTTLHVPKSYQCGTPAPLVVMLHGYSASGAIEELYLGLTKQADDKGFLYVHPDGTTDAKGEKFWNATDACCNFYGSKVDDSTYLLGLVDAIAAEWDVDPKRVYFVGHSNGAFMSYRMACDHADKIAAVVGLAGAMPLDASKCQPSEPVSALAIHGTADSVIGYAGGQNFGNAYPSAEQTVMDWVAIDGCSQAAIPGASIDLEGAIPGAETTVAKHAGCKAGTTVELWSIQGGAHVPTLSASFAPSVVDFLLSQHKP